MPRSNCDACCNPIELARNINSYRAAVLTILCEIATGGGGGGGCCGTLGAVLPAAGQVAGFKDASGNLAAGNLDSSGNLKVSVTGGGGATDLTAINGVAPSVNNGTSDAGTLRVTVASDSTGQIKLAAGSNVIGHVITDTGSTTVVTGNVTAVQATGTNLHTVVDSGTITIAAGTAVIGHVIVDSGTLTTVTTVGTVTAVTAITNALPAGANVIGHVIADSGSTTVVTGNVTVVQPTGTNLHTVVDSGTIAISAGSAVIGHVIVDSGTLTAVTAITNALPAGTNVIGHVITDANSVTAASGDVASGSSDSGNPVKIGGLAKTSLPTAVSDGQRVNGLFDKFGRLISRACLRESLGKQQTNINNSTGETTIVTAGSAGVFQDLYGLILTNNSASSTKVTIKDATSGTTEIVFQVPAGDTRGFMVPADSAIPQTTAANNWTATCGTSISSLDVTALFISNK